MSNTQKNDYPTRSDTAAEANPLEIEKSNLDALREAVAHENVQEITDIFAPLHPADIADGLEQLTTDERTSLADQAPDVFSASVLAELEDEVVEDILPHLDDEQISQALVELDSDDATQIIEELDDDRREDILAGMPIRDREEVEASFTFDDETAGRLMQREFVAAPDFWTAGQTIDHIRHKAELRDESLPELFFNIYVVDVMSKPVGYVPVSKLLGTPRPHVLSEIMTRNLVTIPQDMDQEDIAYQFEKYHLISAPVVDGAGRLTGMITVDDMMDVIQDENKEDMLALAGVSDAGVTDTALTTVKLRAPWLLINLLTAILASIVIANFDYAISQIVALAVLMPIVASMGGNAGTQTLAVAVRALTERDLTAVNTVRAVRREALAALINGIIFAVILAGITYIWFKDLRLSAVIFVAMIINHIFAGLAGILVPLGLKKFGADPAVASSVFVTTVTDIVGFLAFLGLAAAFLL